MTNAGKFDISKLLKKVEQIIILLSEVIASSDVTIKQNEPVFMQDRLVFYLDKHVYSITLVFGFLKMAYISIIKPANIKIGATVMRLVL